MRTVLKSTDFAELVVVKEFPDNFAVQQGLLETIYGSDIPGFEGTTRELLLEGICIEHRDLHHNRQLQIEVAHDYPFFKMHFEMKGFSDYHRKTKGSSDVLINEGCHQLFFFPEVKGKLQYTARHRYTLEIKLTLQHVKKVLGEDLGVMGNFGKSLENMQPGKIGQLSMPILPAMKNVIHQILHCPYTTPMKKIYLEAKVTELLLLQLDQFEQAPLLSETSILKKGDREKLHHVQQLIETNLQEPCSLLELAEKAGLNDFKLKKGFKEVFGNTVFGYMTDIRMEKAKALLLQNSMSIADISFQVGYKNPQHFTAAFKRKFGFLPSQLRK